MGPVRRNIGLVVLTIAVAAIVGVAVAFVPGAGDVGSVALESVDASVAPPDTPLPTTTSSPPTTVPPSTTAPPPSPPTTAQPPSPPTTPPTTVPGPILERDDVIVAVANATNFPGVAGRTATELEALGYVGVAAVDADPVGQTVVYRPDGFDREARRVVEDLGLALVAIPVRPADLAPAVTPTATFDVLVVVGSDQL